MAKIVQSDWLNGSLASTSIVNPDLLQSLTGQATGPPICKSNNPEIFRGNGWLMQHARSSPRGSDRFELRGMFGIYLFHINRATSARVIHILVTNPQSSAVQLSGKGSMFSNASFPLMGRGTGPNYKVARNWLEDNHRIEFDTVTLSPQKAFLVDQHTLNPSNMVDGRFEITASAGVFVYTVITTSGNLNDAVTASRGSSADGDIFSPAINRFGREAGICRHSLWQGTTEIEVPSASAHLGLCLNTSNKFKPSLQDQTSDFIMRLSDSSERSHANYGHQYDVKLNLQNTASTVCKVRLTFASNLVLPVDRPSFTYNGPIRLNGQIKDVFTTPTDPKEVLETFSISPNNSIIVRLQFYVPGLITIGEGGLQLILESL